MEMKQVDYVAAFVKDQGLEGATLGVARARSNSRLRAKRNDSLLRESKDPHSSRLSDTKKVRDLFDRLMSLSPEIREAVEEGRKLVLRDHRGDECKPDKPLGEVRKSRSLEREQWKKEFSSEVGELAWDLAMRLQSQEDVADLLDEIVEELRLG